MPEIKNLSVASSIVSISDKIPPVDQLDAFKTCQSFASEGGKITIEIWNLLDSVCSSLALNWGIYSPCSLLQTNPGSDMMGNSLDESG